MELQYANNAKERKNAINPTTIPAVAIVFTVFSAFNMFCYTPLENTFPLNRHIRDVTIRRGSAESTSEPGWPKQGEQDLLRYKDDTAIFRPFCTDCPNRRHSKGSEQRGDHGLENTDVERRHAAVVLCPNINEQR